MPLGNRFKLGILHQNVMSGAMEFSFMNSSLAGTLLIGTAPRGSKSYWNGSDLTYLI